MARNAGSVRQPRANEPARGSGALIMRAAAKGGQEKKPPMAASARLCVLALAAFMLIMPMAQAAPAAQAVPAQTYDEVLDRGLLNDEAYSIALVKQSREAKDKAERLRLLDEAIAFSPDLPGLYFRRAAATLPHVFDSANFMISGAKAYARNFWWTFSLAGLVVEGLMLSLVLTLFIASAIKLPQRIPLISHEINESKAKILAPLLLLPLSALGPVAFSAVAFCLVGAYMKKSARFTVYLAIFIMLFSPLLYRAANFFFAASTPEVRAIVGVTEGTDNSLALEALRSGEDFPSKFSYALALKRTGRYESAIQIFSELLKKEADPRVYTNLGNAYLAAGLRDYAKQSYEEALKMDRAVVPLYNLSQAYRDELKFEVGDKQYQEALLLNRERISFFTSIAGKSPNRLVIDETLTPREIISVILGNKSAGINLSPANPLVSSAFAFVLLVYFMMSEKRSGNRAARCTSCGRIICPICVETMAKSQLCRECYKSQFSPDDLSPKARVAKLISLSEHKGRMRTRIRVLCFTLPGIAHLYSGKVVSGLLFLWCFLFMFILAVLNPLFATGMAGFSHSWLTPLAVIIMLLLYLLSALVVLSRLERGWL